MFAFIGDSPLHSLLSDDVFQSYFSYYSDWLLHAPLPGGNGPPWHSLCVSGEFVVHCVTRKGAHDESHCGLFVLLFL